MAYRYYSNSCRDGKLYIAPVMDCFGGEIISLAMDDYNKPKIWTNNSKNSEFAVL